MKNNRLVLVNTKQKSYTVYEGKEALATYTEDNSGVPITADIVEQIRIANYNTTKA